MRYRFAPIFRWGIGSSPAFSSISPSKEDFPEGGESAESAPQATRLKRLSNKSACLQESLRPRLAGPRCRGGSRTARLPRHNILGAIRESPLREHASSLYWTASSVGWPEEPRRLTLPSGESSFEEDIEEGAWLFPIPHLKMGANLYLIRLTREFVHINPPC